MNALLAPIATCGRIGRDVLYNVQTFLLQTVLMTRLLMRTIIRLPLCIKNISISIEQMYRIGIESLPLISVIAIFAGAITVIQAVYQFSGIIPMKYLGVAVSKGILLEIGPVFTALIFSCRIATAIAAEIGSMKNSEQIDAMTILGLDHIRYLIVPKTIACGLMLPILVIWAELLAFLGSIVTVILTVENITLFTYMSGLKLLFNPLDLLLGIGKTMVFGVIIAITGAHFGYQARGGAEGVGEATTKAVMTSLILILIFDFFIAFLVL